MSWFQRIFRRKQLQRAELLAQPFPPDWLPTVARCLPCYHAMPPAPRDTLRRAIQVFVAEKRFVGTGGLVVDDEVKVTIAGQACLLIAGIPHLGVFPRLHEIIVHPHVYGEVVEAVGPDGTRYQIPQMRAGEAWRRGPVRLAWDSVTRSIARPCDGYNVVYHEFAHVLDMQDGWTGGSPPLEKEQQVAWARVFDAEYDAFVAAERRGQPTFLNPYGAANPTEFFAVLTEHFFEQPRGLRARHPELYGQLTGFYRQDPARWMSAWQKGQDSAR
ncbi:MAG: zinc-dependent peptidase [Planctomycetes bacterium]|nr:zinc-dependent peptidase [Planctomycetota bacterium]